MSFNFEDERLVEKANILPNQIKFDNIFSNDLSDEEDYDLCFEADEDDRIIAMVSQNEMFNENGVEIPFAYLTEDDEEEDAEGDDVSSSDVDSSAVEGDSDINGVPDSDESEAPKIQVNIDADDVNISAEAPQDEAYLENLLDEDEISINHADVVNVAPSGDNNNSAAPIAGEVGPNPDTVTEPANPPVPTDTTPDTGVDTVAATGVSTDDAIADEPEVDDDTAEPETPDGDDDGVSNDEEVPEDECGSVNCAAELPNLLEGEDSFEDEFNTAGTDSFETEMPYEGPVATDDSQEIPGTTDTPPMVDEAGYENLLDEEDTATNFDGIEKEDNEKHFHDDLKEIDKNLSNEINKAPIDPTKKEEGLKDFEDQHDQFSDVIPNQCPVKTINSAPTDEAKKDNGINDPDSENKFDDDLYKVTTADPENIINKKPEDVAKENPSSVQETYLPNLLEDAEEDDEDYKEDAESGVTQAVATDITGGNENIKNTYNGACEYDCPEDQSGFKQGTKYPNLLEDADPSQGDAPEDPNTSKVFDTTDPATKDTSAYHAVEDEPKNDGEEEAMKTVDDLNVSTSESAYENLLDEDAEGHGILQVDAPENDESMWSAIEKDPKLVTKDALSNFDKIEESNLLDVDKSFPNREDADTNFDGIEDKESSKPDTFDVIPDEVKVPAESKDQDGKKSMVGGPIENGDDELLNTVGESYENLLDDESDFGEVVKGLSSDDVFYDQLNNGLELPKESTDPKTDEAELDDEAINAVE